MQKNERQSKILNIIGSTRVGRQDELVSLLRGHGYVVTQASVSRDLDELGVIKVNGSYAQRENNTVSFGLSLISIESAGDSMVVAKCASGLASASAVRIDAAKIDEIVGTIAGDDTIFIAVRDESGQKAVIKKLRELFKG